MEAGPAGRGVLWLPHDRAAPHLAGGALLPLFADWRIEPMPRCLAWTPRRDISARLRAFIDWIAELMGRHLPVPGLRG